MAFRDEPVVFLFSKMWKFSKGNRHNVVLFILLSVFANLISFLNPLVVGWLLNTIQEQGITAENIWNLMGIVGLFFAITAGFWVLHGPSRVIERNNAFRVRANYKKYLIDGTMDLPASWHTDHHSGDTIDKIEKATNEMFMFSGSVFEIIEAVIRVVSSYIALWYFNFHSAYIVLFVCIVTIMTVFQFDKKMQIQYKNLNLAENSIASRVFDTISNITTVVILRIEKLVSKEIWKKILAPFTLYKKNVAMNEVKWFTVSILAALMTVGVLGSYLLSSVRSGEVILIGTLYVLYGYVDRISGMFFRFTYRYSRYVIEKAAVQNVEPIEELFIEREKIKQVTLKNWKELLISRLTFSYHDDNSELHLKNVTLTIPHNSKIALIGESGGGKTTFLKLLRSLYTPKHVDLVLDDIHLIAGFDSISDSIALIPQDPEIFSSTIKYNITLGVQHTSEYIRKFTDMAMFTSVLRRLPRGLSSDIFEKGVNLSGGEKQRLALARGLMACDDKEIVLLDEPTSSVDAANELKIYENIFRAFKDKTIISTVHRLHLLSMFDMIYMFKGGRIVASGNFSAMKKEKEFLRLWKKYKKGKNKQNS